MARKNNFTVFSSAVYHEEVLTAAQQNHLADFIFQLRSSNWNESKLTVDETAGNRKPIVDELAKNKPLTNLCYERHVSFLDFQR